MADWRTSTLNSNLSTTQRLLNRNFASSAHTSSARTTPTKPSPLLSEDRGDLGDRPNSAQDDNRSETQNALLQETLTALKDEATRLDDDGETGELLSETPVWADVEPWKCPEDGHAVVDIQYTEEYADTMGLLYAVIESGEKSKRVLKLTEKCIMLCPSHYTAWDWRYQCLMETGADMDEEWTICMAIAEHSGKNYQLWNHRRLLAMHMGKENAIRELEFASSFLDVDEKNYHIWAHRQAIVERFGMWKGEWENMLRMIDVDCRNNSAWNQRAWLLSACIACRLRRNLPGPSGGGKSCQEDSALEDADDTQPRFMTGAITEWLQSELECCRYHCERTPHNESPWNYLNGLHSIVHDTVVALDREVEADSVLEVLPESQLCDIQRCQIVIAEGVFSICGDVALTNPACVPARTALFKQYLHMAHASRTSGKPAAQAAKTGKALWHLKHALVKMDPVHANWHRHAFAQLYGDDPSDSAPPGGIPTMTAPSDSGI